MTGREAMEKILRLDEDDSPLVVYMNGERKEVSNITFEPEEKILWVLFEGRNEKKPRKNSNKMLCCGAYKMFHGTVSVKDIGDMTGTWLFIPHLVLDDEWYFDSDEDDRRALTFDPRSLSNFRYDDGEMFEP